MKKTNIAELGHNDLHVLYVYEPYFYNDLLYVYEPCFCLNANISLNVEQNLVAFNQNDLQMELFQIYVTFYTN